MPSGATPAGRPGSAVCSIPCLLEPLLLEPLLLEPLAVLQQIEYVHGMSSTSIAAVSAFPSPRTSLSALALILRGLLLRLART